jgi:proline iminopeptidase
MMKAHRAALSVSIFFILAALTISCSKEPALQEPTHGESILDKTSHIKPKLLTEIPATFRWCDRIAGLDKRRINVGDAELYVEVEGKGTPIVLINGGPGGTHHYFHPWFSRLRKNATVVYYDQRGCGLSDFKPGAKGYSVEQAAEDLDAVRKALRFKKWVVLGYSYGGFLAQLYTVLHPENVAGLVLLGASPGMRADDGPSREDEFVTVSERTRMKELRAELREYAKAHDLPRQKMVELSIYNNFSNGDWKRQNFYRPSPERLAQGALYEWVNDNNFNGIIGQTEGRWDFTGAFARNPIPTLILEGKWDLTWGEKKRDILKDNHPGARMVVFENASHGIYDEAPDEFFRVLKGFIKDLPKIDAAGLANYQAFLGGWVREMKSRPEILVYSFGWGMASSRELAGKYTPKWVETISSTRYAMRIGFALYDVKRYADALDVYERMETRFGADPKMKAFALIWQGHMLDLLGKRAEAVKRYRKAAELKIADSWTHSQYGLKYELSAYALERVKTPFKRIENNSLD